MIEFFNSIYKKQKNKIFSFLLMFLLVGGVLAPYMVHAATPGFSEGLNGAVCGTDALELSTNISCYLGKTMRVGIGLLLGIPLFFAGLFDIVSGTLLRVTIQATTSITLTQNLAVTQGFTITRNFANMLIVIALIIIALATILRIKNFEAQKLLPRLIIAALLINFSLVICGLAIDASTIVIRYLFIPTNGTSVADGVQQFVNTAPFERAASLARNLGSSPTDILTFIIQIIGNVAYSMTSGAVLILYVFLFLFRIVALIVLLILSPLAFACSILPQTNYIYEKWRDNFLQWCFAGILGGLFLNIGEQLMNRISAPGVSIIDLSVMNNSLIQTARTASNYSISVATATTAVQAFSNMVSFFIPAIFLIIGFLFTMQMSAMGASIATSWGKSAGLASAKFVGNWASNKTGLTRLKETTIDRATRMGETFGFVTAGTANIRQQERIKRNNASAQTAAVDPKTRLNIALGGREGLSGGPVLSENAKNRRLEAIRQMAEKGELNGKNVSSKQRKDLMTYAVSNGVSIKDFIKADPTLARFNKSAIDKQKEDLIGKESGFIDPVTGVNAIYTPSDVSNSKSTLYQLMQQRAEGMSVREAVQKAQPYNVRDYSKEILQDFDVQIALDVSKVKAIGKGGSQQAKDTLKKSFGTTMGRIALFKEMENRGIKMTDPEFDKMVKIAKHISTDSDFN